MQTPLALTADEVHLTVEPASGAVPAFAQVRLDDQLCFALYTAATEVVLGPTDPCWPSSG